MKKKLTFVFFTLSLFFLLIAGKALHIQVISRDKLVNYSKSQIVRTAKVYPKRGQIYDRNNDPLAINIRTYNIFTIPRKDMNFLESYKKLSALVPGINYKELQKKVKKRNKYTWISRRVELTEEVYQKIKSLPGIYIDEEYARVYPNHELLSQVLGFVGIDNEGLSGVEYFFNDKLKGTPHIYKYMRDAKGRAVKFENTIRENKSEDIVLSIDKSMQASLETYLKEAVEKHEALKGGAAVMDAETGEIWAMANYPSFDPNEYSKYSSESRKLSFISDPFEPGSIFKTFTVASGLENKIITPTTNYYCEDGKFLVGNHYIKESDKKHAHKWLSVSDIIKFSSNIGTSKIAFDLGYPIFKETLQKFNIGEKTNIELPGESRGIFELKDNIGDLRLSNISFGQGVATTGIQMLAAYAAIANGGTYHTPTILKKEGKSLKGKRIISQDTSMKLTQMLIGAVHDGTGKRARVNRFLIAGKTSTAQRASKNGGYEGYVSGFMGYPVNVDKKFVVFVYIDYPKKGYYGSDVAAPVFQKITNSVLLKNKEFGHLDNESNIYLGESFDEVRVLNSSLRKKVKKGIMPDLLGLDKITAESILNELDLYYENKGHGVVSFQSIKAGESLENIKKVNLKFEIPKYE